jgi:hypothetical protein
MDGDYDIFVHYKFYDRWHQMYLDSMTSGKPMETKIPGHKKSVPVRIAMLDYKGEAPSNDVVHEIRVTWDDGKVLVANCGKGK